MIDKDGRYWVLVGYEYRMGKGVYAVYARPRPDKGMPR